jgi:hypothetical protein
MRVIAGEAKGRQLIVPAGGGTRSATDRVRETLFGILEPQLPDAIILDLFAGAGTLGIEALSRGAARATFVEQATGAHDRDLTRAQLVPHCHSPLEPGHVQLQRRVALERGGDAIDGKEVTRLKQREIFGVIEDQRDDPEVDEVGAVDPGERRGDDDLYAEVSEHDRGVLAGAALAVVASSDDERTRCGCGT